MLRDSYEMGPFTPPRPLGGLFLYFGSELGGGDGTSDPSADGRTSCLKKSAGEWSRGSSRRGCVPGGHVPAPHPSHAHARPRVFPCPFYFFTVNKVPHSSPSL